MVISATLLWMAVSVWPFAAQERKPPTKLEVMELLESGVTPKRVGELAKQFGLAFSMTVQTETQLMAAGATDDLLGVLRSVAPKTPPEAPGSAATALLIEVTPGGAQVYVDDELMGTTSAQGRVKLSRLSPGTHRVRLSLAGHRDYERVVEIEPGAIAHLTGMLEIAPDASNPLAAEASGGNPLALPSGAVNPLAGGESGAPPTAASATDFSAVPEATAQITRFRIAHDHGGGGSDYCMSWMTVAEGRVRFQADNGKHSFDIPVSEIQRAQKNRVYLAMIGGFHIRVKKGANYNLVLFNESNQPQSPDTLLTLIAVAMSLR